MKPPRAYLVTEGGLVPDLVAAVRAAVAGRPPGALAGSPCHSAEDVARAAAGGADFATFGPVFDTPSKRRFGAPVGLGRLAEAARLGLPLLGLGGGGRSQGAGVV